MAKLVSKTYSHALFEVAIESNLLERVSDDFEFVVKSLEEYPSFYEIIISPKIQSEEKKQIMDDTFGGKISSEVLNFIKILIDKKREGYIKEIFSEFKKISNDHNGLVVAKVESVISLEEDVIKKLEAKLNTLTGKTVTVKNVINPEIVGGLIVNVGDKIIDGSVRKKLENLKNDLAQIII